MCKVKYIVFLMDIVVQIDIVAVTDLPDGVKIQASPDLLVHVKKMKGMKVELVIHTEYSQD